MECRSFYFWKTKGWFFFQKKNWQQINNMSTVIHSEWLEYGWWLFSSLGFFSIFKNAKSFQKKEKKMILENEEEMEKVGSRWPDKRYGKKQFRWERCWRPELDSKKMEEIVNGVKRCGDWLYRGSGRGKNLWFLAFQFMVVMPFTEPGNFKGIADLVIKEWLSF